MKHRRPVGRSFDGFNRKLARANARIRELENELAGAERALGALAHTLYTLSGGTCMLQNAHFHMLPPCGPEHGTCLIPANALPGPGSIPAPCKREDSEDRLRVTALALIRLRNCPPELLPERLADHIDRLAAYFRDRGEPLEDTAGDAA